VMVMVMLMAPVNRLYTFLGSFERGDDKNKVTVEKNVLK